MKEFESIVMGKNSIPALSITIILMIAMTVGFFIYWRLKNKQRTNISYLIAGIVGFMVSARVLELGVHYFCIIMDNPVSRFISGSTAAYVLYGVTMAGVFEECGRHIVLKYIMKKNRTRENAVLYGIGHGGIEILGVILPSIITCLVVAIMFSNGPLDVALATLNITEETAAAALPTVKAAAAFDYGMMVKFGSCLVQAVSENDVISIPGIRSQASRDIYVKTLAGIINARTKMIMEQVDYEIKLSGFSNKLIAGVVLTGGGAQLKNIKDLCELITTTDSRIGIPNEHLDPESVSYAELAHPMYATGIGLVLYGLEQSERKHKNEEEKTQTTKSKPTSGGHIDLFGDMPETPKQEPEAEPVNDNVKTKKDKDKEKGKAKFEDVIGRFFTSVFNEGIDD